MCLNAFAVSIPSTGWRATSSIVRISGGDNRFPVLSSGCPFFSVSPACARSRISTSSPVTTNSLCLLGDTRVRCSSFMLFHLPPEVLTRRCGSESKKLHGVSPQEFSLGFFFETEAVDLLEALLPRQAVGSPQAAVHPHPAVDVMNDLGLEIFRHPGVDPEVNVVPLVADRDQILDPAPAGVGGHDVQVSHI